MSKYDNMDGVWERYAKWDTEEDKYCVISYAEKAKCIETRVA